MAVVVSAGELRDLAEPYARPSGGYAGLTVADPGVPLFEYFASEPRINPRKIWASQPSVRKVIDFIARGIASVPMHTYEMVSPTDRQRMRTGPVDGTLSNPGQRVTPFRFWHGVIVDWLLWDRWCVLKAPSVTRPVGSGVDLIRIPARRVKFEGDALGRVTGIKVAGREQALDPATCLYDFGYSPGGVGGLTPLQTLSQILLESHEAVEWRRSLWKRGARIPAVIERPADAPPWDVPRPGSTTTPRQRFLESWKSFTKDGGAGGGTPILEDGMTLKKVEAFSPNDVRDVEFRKLTDAEVSSAFHIAPELVGAREGTYSNIAAYREMLYGDALGGYFVPLEQVVNVMLVPDLDTTGRVYSEWNIDAKLRGSFEEQAKVLSTATGRPWMTSAEARARVNLPDLGGDTDQLVTPLNVTIGGLASPRDTAPDPLAE